MPDLNQADTGYYLNYGVSGYGVALLLISDELLDEGAVKAIAEEVMSAVTKKIIEGGARTVAHVKADLRTDGGTIHTHTIGAAHGIYTVGHLTQPATHIHVVLSSMVQGISEEAVQKATLEGIRLAASTYDLEVVKEREHTYFNPAQSPGEGALLLNKDLTVVEANYRAGLVYGMSTDDLVGKSCWTLLDSSSQETLYRAVKILYSEQKWQGELKGMRTDGNIFPVEARINWVAIDQQEFIQVIIRDVTEQKGLEESLRREKRRLKELNITLRNLLVAIESEKKHLEKNIAQKLETLILPTLEKAKNEPSTQLRNAYLDIIGGQLIALSKGVSHEFESRFFKLTRTEMNICQLIQSGYTSKEIASTLNIAFDTVQTHRRNIRKKLGLRGRNVNLFSYLSAR